MAMIRKASHLLQSSHKDKCTNARVSLHTQERRLQKQSICMRASFTAALSGLWIPLFPPPPPSLAFIYFFALFSHSISPLFLSTALVHDPLSSPPCLCMLPSLISFSLARHMNILELRSLKGTMKRPPS